MKIRSFFWGGLFCLIPLFSCAHEDEYLEDFVLEIEQKNDTIISNDSTRTNETTSPNDSVNSKDTISSPSQSQYHKESMDTIVHGYNVTDTLICSYEKYMSIPSSAIYGTGQGGACYDKYFFQGYSNNAAIGIFDLEKKECLGKVDITEPTPNSKIHANTINFGTQRYNDNDFFPLLYVNSGYTQKVGKDVCSFIYVYRILHDVDFDGAEVFSAILVQTITMKGFETWTEGILDNDNNMLWVKYIPNGAEGPFRYASFDLPKYDKANVDILQKDYLVDFPLEPRSFTSSSQGHLFYKDRILLVGGTAPSVQKLTFIVINTITRIREHVVDLEKLGLRDEPENLFFYKDQLMIGYRRSLYKFNVKVVSKDSIN